MAGSGTGPYFWRSQGSGSSVAYKTPTAQTFLSTGSQTGWLFTVSGWTGTLAVGDTYTNNSNTYTVQGAQTNGTGQTLFMSGTGATSGGTLTKSVSASGPATITFSAKIATALYTTPTPTTPIYLRVRVVGGGGGGGGSGTGSPASGTVGNASWFGANLVLCNGGALGTAAGAGGLGGTVTITTITQLVSAPGSAGQNPDATSTTLNAFGGDGGAGVFAGAGLGGSAGGAGNSAIANSGSGGGGGGGGAASYAASGGGGAGGYAEAFISNPIASYPYIVGASAAGGRKTG